MLQSGMLHLICVARCILPVLHAVSCRLFLHVVISVARCPFCTLHADCGMLSVMQATRCLWHPVRFAIIVAYRDSRCILHLSCCASHGVLTACLPRAAAAASTDDGALAHARGAWVSTYPITVVATSPMTAPPTTVGNRSRYIHMRPDKGCSTHRRMRSALIEPWGCRVTCAHPLPVPRDRSRCCMRQSHEM